MTNLIDNPEFTSNEVYEIAQTDKLEGAAAGASFGGLGISNYPHQQLANRTAYLLQQLNLEISNRAAAVSSAISTAEAYAAAQASAAQSAAQSYATNLYNTEVANRQAAVNSAITTSENYALSLFSAYGLSLAGSGYFKMPNGLIIQWGGVVTGPFAGVYFTPIYFPIAFPNYCFAVVKSTMKLVVGTYPTNYVYNLSGVPSNQMSTNGAYMSFDRDGDGYNRGFWIALGY
ncbi:MAG: hypothetical protein KGL39_28160 [Patescibacteria group bacterium]|nr:hypothetical protein [Patescibacteria group bacterium]